MKHIYKNLFEHFSLFINGNENKQLPIVVASRHWRAWRSSLVKEYFSKNRTKYLFSRAHTERIISWITTHSLVTTIMNTTCTLVGFCIAKTPFLRIFNQLFNFRMSSRYCAVITVLLLPSVQLTAVPLSATQLHQYFWANYQLFNRDAHQTNTWYQELLQNNPPIYVYKGYLDFLTGVGQFQRIVALMPQLDPHFTTDVDIQLQFAQALQQTGNNQEAEKRFIKLHETFKTNTTVVFQTALVYVNRKDIDRALHTIDTFLNSTPKRPNNFVFHFLKAQIYLQLQNKEKALEAVTACLDMHKQFDKGWLLFALLQEQKGALQEAITGYTNFLEISKSSDPALHQHLLQLTFLQKNNQSSQPTINTHFSLALTSFDEKKYDTALQQINQCLKQLPADPQARLLKIQILSALNKYNDAAKTIKTWILEQPSEDEWYMALCLLCTSGFEPKKAIKVLEAVVHQYPNNIKPYLYLADLCSRAGILQTAVTYHEKILQITQDPLLQTKVLFNLARLYYGKQKFNKAEAALEQGYALGQNFLPLLNLLAYNYATQSKNLTKAEQLIKTVLEKSTNPHFLDTYALVLYKQKKYDQALQILQSITEQTPQDFTILKHLAKTYHRLGDSPKAVETIQKATAIAQTESEKNKAQFILNQWNQTTS
ncbi:MAG TPA: tetratricopeptide repeat protein [Candidatus Babeliales bacterium]|nr:tetratricopeptide repeat protein [Candidatus Babeliales bacterium]